MFKFCIFERDSNRLKSTYFYISNVYSNESIAVAMYECVRMREMMDNKQSTKVIKIYILTIDINTKGNWEANLQITFSHNHQISLRIHLNVGRTCLYRLSKNHVLVRWAISRKLFSHHSLKRALFQLSVWFHFGNRFQQHCCSTG